MVPLAQVQALQDKLEAQRDTKGKGRGKGSDAALFESQIMGLVQQVKASVEGQAAANKQAAVAKAPAPVANIPNPVPFMQQQISDRDQIIVDLRNQNDELVAALQKTQSSAMSKLFQAQLEIARARSGAQEAALQQVLTITNNLQTSGASVRSNTSAQVFASLHQMQPQATAPEPIMQMPSPIPRMHMPTYSDQPALPAHTTPQSTAASSSASSRAGSTHFGVDPFASMLDPNMDPLNFLHQD